MLVNIEVRVRCPRVELPKGIHGSVYKGNIIRLFRIGWVINVIQDRMSYKHNLFVFDEPKLPNPFQYINDSDSEETTVKTLKWLNWVTMKTLT